MQFGEDLVRSLWREVFELIAISHRSKSSWIFPDFLIPDRWVNHPMVTVGSYFDSLNVYLIYRKLPEGNSLIYSLNQMQRQGSRCYQNFSKKSAFVGISLPRFKNNTITKNDCWSPCVSGGCLINLGNVCSIFSFFKSKFDINTHERNRQTPTLSSFHWSMVQKARFAPHKMSDSFLFLRTFGTMGLDSTNFWH